MDETGVTVVYITVTRACDVGTNGINMRVHKSGA